MKKLPIIEASDQQLRDFAVTQQIDNIPTARGELIAALLQAGWDSDFIMLAGETPAAAVDNEQPALPQLEEGAEMPAPMPSSGFSYWKKSPMVTLRILPTDRPGGNEPAHPSVNGSLCLVIQRNKLVSIPHDFYLVLRQAGGTKVTPGEKPTDPLIYTDYFEYPMVDVELPPLKEIEAWRIKTSGDELGRPKAKAA